MHGGSARQVRKAAARRLAAREALSSLTMLGEPVADVDPATAVLEQISHAAGYVAWLRDRVRELDPAEVDQGSASPWLALYDSERDRLVKWSDLAVRLGIETRRIQLAEQTGGLVVGLLRSVLAELNLTPAQHAVVAQVVPVKLRELTAALTDGN